MQIQHNHYRQAATGSVITVHACGLLIIFQHVKQNASLVSKILLSVFCSHLQFIHELFSNLPFSATSIELFRSTFHVKNNKTANCFINFTSRVGTEGELRGWREFKFQCTALVIFFYLNFSSQTPLCFS